MLIWKYKFDMSDIKVQNKESQILEAAEHEFLEKGYGGARTASIAKAAGVTHAMLHYYYRTKEQLFERVMDKKMSELVPMVSHLFGNASLPLTERIKEAVSIHFDFVSANPELPRFLVNEVLLNAERFNVLKSKIEGYFHLFADLQKEVDEAASRGEIESFNVLLLFQTVLSLNVFPSLMVNVMTNVADGEKQVLKELFAARKAENVEIIMRRIRKV